MNEIEYFEALGLRVWPPAETADVDGWTLCLSEGTTRRTNSVQTSLETRGEQALDARIEGCEALYRERGLPAVFKLTEATRPPGLEPALAARGYVAADPTSVQVASLAARSFTVEPKIEVSESLEEPWFAACLRLNQVRSERGSGLREVLERVPAPRALASLGRGDRTIAQAVAVLADAQVFLCLIATDPASRRAGHARRMVETLLDWGVARGATHAWLQVVAENEPAIQLYAGLGFEELYRYWYRQPGRG